MNVFEYRQRIRYRVRIVKELKLLRDGLAAELAGLNIFGGERVLVYVRDRLLAAAAEIDQLLVVEVGDGHDPRS